MLPPFEIETVTSTADWGYLRLRGVEYDDGTPATESQMAKDVTTFLAWAAEPEHDERKLMGVKWIFVLSLVLMQAVYYKRLRFAPLKSRKIIVDAVN